MDLLLLLLVLLLRREAGALKLLDVSVPPYTLRGENALLVCRYDLGSDKLYAVSWYKDNEEFYRYVPKGAPNQHSYRVEGVKVDHHSSNEQKVLLQNVGLTTSGRYKCEVSAEAPNFTLVQGEAPMEVVSLPREDPVITGEEEIYSTGDILALNCTTAKSHPPARIAWYVNGVQLRADSETTIGQHGLVSSVSSLRLEVGPRHLSSGRISVRCEATIQLIHQEAEALMDLRDTQVFGTQDTHHQEPKVHRQEPGTPINRSLKYIIKILWYPSSGTQDTHHQEPKVHHQEPGTPINRSLKYITRIL
ncbi:uncharacterized protein LOC105694928 [Orussus abietinus]|uniref:uncharacterized protein LOC105694928 n=1 Tax=Orussus abietinus TaxID=222816 RepID=UPI000C71611C|nr:uncharacterized protein LOC105694928 [Orussus abietinus]